MSEGFRILIWRFEGRVLAYYNSGYIGRPEFKRSDSHAIFFYLLNSGVTGIKVVGRFGGRVLAYCNSSYIGRLEFKRSDSHATFYILSSGVTGIKVVGRFGGRVLAY